MRGIFQALAFGGNIAGALAACEATYYSERDCEGIASGPYSGNSPGCHNIDAGHYEVNSVQSSGCSGVAGSTCGWSSNKCTGGHTAIVGPGDFGSSCVSFGSSYDSIGWTSTSACN